MKKFLRCFLVCLLLVVTACTFVACEQEEIFQADDGSIMILLTDKFEKVEKEGSSLYIENKDGVKFNATYETRASIDSAAIFGDYLLMQPINYANYYIISKNLDTQAKKDDASNTTYFELETDSTYSMCVVIKGTDTFWVCQFVCPKDKKGEYKENFFDWAQTIIVE